MKKLTILVGLVIALALALPIIVLLAVGTLALALEPGLRDLGVEPADVTFVGPPDGRIRLTTKTGDINGDGFDDIVLISERVNGPTGNRVRSGAIFVIFGRSMYPGLFDLPNDADLIIYGAYEGQQLGEDAAIQDVNGDGRDDIIAVSPDFGGRSKGRIDIIFGAPSFPSVMDLAITPADITILGRENDLGSGITVGDVDGDGRTDLIVADRQGDGPPSIVRNGAGEAYIFLDAKTLPPVIDLETFSPDVTVYGVDPGDNFSFEIDTGDFDGDGRDEIVFGTNQPRGIDNNSMGEAGEVRVLLGRAVWPVSIDLASEPADATIFGEDAHNFSNALMISNVVGDETPDLIVAASLADTATGRVYLFDGDNLLGAFGLASQLATNQIRGIGLSSTSG